MPRVQKKWKLPRPDKGPKREWHPVVRLGSVVPFGYRQDDQDKDVLLPIPEELELLEEAKKHLKKYSSREVAEWLTRNSGRAISHTGLLERVKLEQKRQKALSITEYYARRYEEAKRKAEKIQRSLGGQR